MAYTPEDVIKRTLCFASPGKLRLHLRQLLWQGEDGREASIPIEDIGILLLDSPLITLSSALLQSLTEACVAVILCDRAHLPSGYLLPQNGHTLAHRILFAQMQCSEARARTLWQQIVCAKIRNQAGVLHTWAPEVSPHLLAMASRVKRGDPENLEGQAARTYFAAFPTNTPFLRDRNGSMPNAALNYGYAILRAAVARALVAAGLHPSLGLHHRNQYNPFCLADDLIEPYRPYVDRLVLDNLPAFTEIVDPSTLTPENKRLLLPLLTEDVIIASGTRPLFNALQLSAASLARALQGAQKTLELPQIPCE